MINDAQYQLGEYTAVDKFALRLLLAVCTN